MNLDQARRLIAEFVNHYNTVRLHSVIGYIISQGKLLSNNDMAIFAVRGQKFSLVSQAPTQNQTSKPTRPLHNASNRFSQLLLNQNTDKKRKKNTIPFFLSYTLFHACTRNILYVIGGMRNHHIRKVLAGCHGILVISMATVPATPPMAPPPAPPPTVNNIVPAPTTKPAALRRNQTPLEIPPPPPDGGGSVATWREHAENDAEVTAVLTSARPVVQNVVLSEGAGAFHLAHPTGGNESITLSPVILPGAATKLFFKSRLTYATSTQVARAQVSTDGGGTWSTIWSQAGTDNAGEGSFKLVTLPLATYAGTSIRIRFLYELTGGTYYNQVFTAPPVGWFIDDIQIGENFIKAAYTGFGDPTADEVQMLEFINRARADAAAEAARLKATTDPDILTATSFYGVDFNVMTNQFATLDQTTQPLSMNAQLLASARLHSLDMLNNVFQGHSSSANPPLPNQPGDSLVQRIQRQNYNYQTLSENVFSYAKNVWYAHAGFNIDWGNGPSGMQSPPGHRLTIHNGDFREVGIGLVWGTNSMGTNTVGPMLVTQDFGTQYGGGQPFITGVVYDDANTNGICDPNEGVGGVRIDVEGADHYAISSTHGVYSIPVSSNGVYPVTFQRTGYPNVNATATITNLLNAKVDYRSTWARIESVQYTAPNAVQLVVAHGRPSDTLELQTSGNLNSWTNSAFSQTTLPGGRTQLNVTLPGSPAKIFFRVNATWSAP